MTTEDYASLMEEPSGGHNHGRMDGNTLDTDESVAFGFRFDGGWHVADIRSNKDEAGGLVSHRGVLAPAEYVDPDVLRPMVEEALGFTVDDVTSVYTSRGRFRNDLRQLRARIDARLLALSRSGGNMAALARSLGINPRTMERALARARAAEVGLRSLADEA